MNVTKSITVNLSVEDVEQAIVEYLRKAGYHEGSGYNYDKKDIRFDVDAQLKLQGVTISTKTELVGPLKPTTR